MGRLFTDATPEQEQAFVEERRKFQFLTACRLPLSWLIPARRHKWAADILYEIAHEANEREFARSLARFKSDRSEGSESRTLEGQELIDHYNTDLLGDYFLLVGYALECVLKGCLLAMLPELVNDDMRFDKVIVTHNLRQLCHDCAIMLSPEEGELLDHITHFIIWGKYPVPLKIEDMPSWVDDDDQKTKSLSIGSPFHERRVQSMVNGVFQRGLDLLNSFRNSQP